MSNRGPAKDDAELISMKFKCSGKECELNFKENVDVGECCGGHITVEPCPICGKSHEFHSEFFRENTY